MSSCNSTCFILLYTYYRICPNFTSQMVHTGSKNIFIGTNMLDLNNKMNPFTINMAQQFLMNCEFS